MQTLGLGVVVLNGRRRSLDAPSISELTHPGLTELVAGLPERYRSALILRYMEGLRLEEVAAVLKQPLGTVKSNVHRAVNALREALSDSRRGGVMARQEVRS